MKIGELIGRGIMIIIAFQLITLPEPVTSAAGIVILLTALGITEGVME